jgi:hypothetical protein
MAPVVPSVSRKRGLEMDSQQKQATRPVGVRIVLALATVALLTTSVGAGVAAAGDGGQHAATFTKYITTWPSMAGVVGGSVGEGAFSGTVIDYAPGATTLITAIYHFGGSRHDFTARMHVEQTGLHAILAGVVTDGWGKGKLVTGSYDQITCSLSGGPTDCFQGFLEFGKNSGD